jgi:two-component system sensor histidine kinase CpxA
MRSLFLRFFISFWVLIGIIVGGAAVSGFLYAERLQATIEDFEVGESMSEASDVLANGGRQALVGWLRELPRDDGVIVFVVDEDGRDISGRDVPFGMQRYFQRHQARLHSDGDGAADGRDHRRYRRLPHLTAPNGDVLTMLVTPSRSPNSFLNWPNARYWLLAFALLASGLVSYALAATFSRPVRKLRDATVALADGDLDVRIGDTLGKRRDELGMLGKDFDTMAEKLQHAAEQQTELSRNISHELRSPLARMRVALELARRKSGELPEFDRLETDAERLDSLIGQILSYTRLDADFAADEAPVDLHDVISEVIENVEFEYGYSGRISVADLPEAGTAIRGRRGALTSAFENILRNAVRHSPAGGTVRIDTAMSADDVVITIADDGPGVEDADLPKLFEPFFRTNSSAEADGNGGTGLGLAIAKRAIQLHDGVIEAVNGEAGGLVVRISLPARR